MGKLGPLGAEKLIGALGTTTEGGADYADVVSGLSVSDILGAAPGVTGTAPEYSIDNDISYRQLFLPFYNN